MIFKCTTKNNEIIINYISPTDAFLNNDVQVLCFGITDLSLNTLQFLCNTCNCKESKKCTHINVVEEYINKHKKENILIHMIEETCIYFDNILNIVKDSKFLMEVVDQCYEKFNINKFRSDINNLQKNLDKGISLNISFFSKIVLIQKIICYILIQHCQILDIYCCSIQNSNPKDKHKWLWSKFFKHEYKSNTALDMYISMPFNHAEQKLCCKLEQFLNTIAYHHILLFFDCKIKTRFKISKNLLLMNVIIFQNNKIISNAIENFHKENIYLIDF